MPAGAGGGMDDLLSPMGPSPLGISWENRSRRCSRGYSLLDSQEAAPVCPTCLQPRWDLDSTHGLQ